MEFLAPNDPQLNKLKGLFKKLIGGVFEHTMLENERVGMFVPKVYIPIEPFPSDTPFDEEAILKEVVAGFRKTVLCCEESRAMYGIAIESEVTNSKRVFSVVLVRSGHKVFSRNGATVPYSMLTLADANHALAWAGVL